MKRYETISLPTGVRFQWELTAEPETRKLLTLEQMLTVLRRTLRPETFTCVESGEELENADALLIGHSGEATCRSYSGEWVREGISGTFYLDDAVADNGDGTMAAGFCFMEVTEGADTAEGWFAQVAKALDEAEENLLLFGRI